MTCRRPGPMQSFVLIMRERERERELCQRSSEVFEELPGSEDVGRAAPSTPQAALSSLVGVTASARACRWLGVAFACRLLTRWGQSPLICASQSHLASASPRAQLWYSRRTQDLYTLRGRCILRFGIEAPSVGVRARIPRRVRGGGRGSADLGAGAPGGAE